MTERDKRFLGPQEHVSGQANKPLSLPPHALTCDAFVTELVINAENGLSSDEAAKRLQEYGLNELDDGPGVQPFKILVRQIANAMILVKRSTVQMPDDNSSDPIF